jgi:hypothetical protein
VRLTLAAHTSLQAVAGLEAPSPLVATLQQAAGARQWGALAQHCVASGLLGPLWEEVCVCVCACVCVCV